MTFIRLCKFLTVLLLCTLFHLEARGGCVRPPQGPPGTPGTDAPEPAFLSVFTLDGCQSIGCLGVLPETAVTFENISAGPIGDISYDPTTGTVTFLSVGFYEVKFGMTVDADVGGNADVALQINPAGVYTTIPGFVPGSGIVSGSVLDVVSPDLMTNLRVIVQITEVNQTLQLVNVSLSNIRFDTQSAGTLLDPVLAYLSVKRL